MNRILIIASGNGTKPYVPELMDAMRERGFDVDFFDISASGSLGSRRVAEFLISLPWIGLRIRAFLLRLRLRAVPDDYSSVNMHMIEPVFSLLARPLKRKGAKLIASIWGSDFLRANARSLRLLGRTLSMADLITSNNQAVLDGLASRFPSAASRLRLVRFGLKSLDAIERIMRSEGKASCKRRFDIPEGKVAVALGYNGSPAQQHVAMLGSLGALAEEHKRGIHFVLPMTYPDDPAYREDVRRAIRGSGLSVTVISDFLSGEDVARLRLACDVCVNAQITDSFSGSVQESLFAGNRLVVGSWLPYLFLRDFGVAFHSFDSIEEMPAALLRCIAEPELGESVHASEVIGALSRWNSVVADWERLYA
jgi:hypothetical protein